MFEKDKKYFFKWKKYINDNSPYNLPKEIREESTWAIICDGMEVRITKNGEGFINLGGFPCEISEEWCEENER